jgi:AcrR family transcriptional regulator
MSPVSTLIYDERVPPASTTPRATYHHGNLRAALVEAATELARASGPDGVVLREVARRTGVSHNAAYRHFADRDELLGEVAAVGGQRLEEAMRARLARVRAGDAAEAARRRLRAVGRAYVEFALGEPGLFETVFSGAPPADGQDPYRSPADGPYGLLGQVLDENVAHGNVRPDRRPGAEVVCWAAVHGFAGLHLRGPLAAVPAKERDRALELMLDRIEQGLG